MYLITPIFHKSLTYNNGMGAVLYPIHKYKLQTSVIVTQSVTEGGEGTFKEFEGEGE